MESPTFEALKKIMELIRPRGTTPMELREDWQRVAVWMDEAARDIDDLDTLGREAAGVAASGMYTNIFVDCENLHIASF